jgi:hypothetical protein
MVEEMVVVWSTGSPWIPSRKLLLRLALVTILSPIPARIRTRMAVMVNAIRELLKVEVYPSSTLYTLTE